MTGSRPPVALPFVVRLRRPNSCRRADGNVRAYETSPAMAAVAEKLFAAPEDYVAVKKFLVVATASPLAAVTVAIFELVQITTAIQVK
jgi:hypothetical protein